MGFLQNMLASLSVKHDSPDLWTAGERPCAAKGRRGLKMLEDFVGDVFQRRRKADSRSIEEISNIEPCKAFVTSMSSKLRGRGVLSSSPCHLSILEICTPDKLHSHLAWQVHDLDATDDQSCIDKQRFSSQEAIHGLRNAS